MRLILSRKGFDSSAGGCPSPIFPDGRMLSLPIPDKRAPVRYTDLTWRGRNLGDVVAQLTRGRVRAEYRAHLDPDLRRGLLVRRRGWRPALGQGGAAQGHLRKQGVAEGDLFLFWGLFRPVDERLRWAGPAQHLIWGWMQVGAVVPVDKEARGGGPKWDWASQHPHLSCPPDETNTLYVGRSRLAVPGRLPVDLPGVGVFERAHDSLRLTAPGAKRPSEWSLPGGFFPGERPALSYHGAPDRWRREGDRALLRAAARGQEFVLDLDLYPEVTKWVVGILRRGVRG